MYVKSSLGNIHQILIQHELTRRGQMTQLGLADKGVHRFCGFAVI
jgi:hypothetical protein